MVKEKVGKLAYDLMVEDFRTEDSKKPNVWEQSLEMQREYTNYLIDCAKHANGQIKCVDFDACKHKKCDPITVDFFIEVLTMKEKSLQNVIRTRFVPRRSCPTPNYGQTVYRYNSILERLEEIWAIPDKDHCLYFIENTKEIKPDFYKLVDYVFRFANGELFELCKKYNNEKDESPELDTVQKNFSVN